MSEGFDLRLAMGVATAFEVRGNDVERAAFALPEGTVGSLSELGSIGELVASASCLGFATEIYLKTLLAGFGTKVPPIHRLAVLFDRLPDSAKLWADDLYASELLASSRSPAITLAVGALELPEWKPAHDRPRDVATALSIVSDAFTDWRYAFEIAVRDGERHQIRYLEYGSLLICCRVFGAMCEELVLKPARP